MYRLGILSDRRLITVLRIVLAAIFLAAAIPKLRDPNGFAIMIDNYRMLPDWAVRLYAVALPVVELFVAACLLVGLFDAGASLLVFLMMAMFTVAVGVALVRGLDISCGCFDTDVGTKIGLKKIAENLGLTLLALRVWTGNRSWLSLGGFLAGRRRSAK